MCRLSLFCKKHSAIIAISEKEKYLDFFDAISYGGCSEETKESFFFLIPFNTGHNHPPTGNNIIFTVTIFIKIVVIKEIGWMKSTSI